MIVIQNWKMKKMIPAESHRFRIPLQMSAAFSKLKSDRGGPFMLIRIKQSRVGVFRQFLKPVSM